MTDTDNRKWELLSSEYLIQRPWLTARRDHVRLPNGAEIPEYYILEYPDWINVIAITEDGKKTQLMTEEQPSNGVKGYNGYAINVAWMGGISNTGKAIDNRTDAQKQSLRELLTELKHRYPDAKILGHRDISPDKNHNGVVDPWERIKECPCFDAITEYADIK